ncbi:hypothetical protein FE257_009122 [Aspergillus nanangensis]|uniref:Rhodopsin domain-containing protein n=1 Tax=Aspergillus nanangensis TaxID=2582783 RepID=A0AAD4GXS9_ASPNN|nr:hypothetical protein FE257_009122 [Aspergillus nanangensis]
MDPSKMPAAPPPPGVTPNFIDPPGEEYEIYSISIALCSTATVVLLGRLYTRVFILRALGLDDWLCVLGQICAWIFAILSILNIKNGYGVHIWNLHVDQVIIFKQYDLAEEDVYALGVWFVKTAILVLYLRLSPEKRFRQMTYAIMIFVAFYSLLSILLFTIGCMPVKAMWDITLMDHAKCIDQLAFVYANAAFNIFSDLVTLILPIRLCWDLQASSKQKALLLLLFIMGSFACVVAIVRIVTMVPFLHSNDFTWYKVTIAKWCMVEINVGIICACLPTMRPLLIKSFPRLFSTIDTGSGFKGPSSDNSYPMKPYEKKRTRGWDHLTGFDTQCTTQYHQEPNELDSSQALVTTKQVEQEPPTLKLTDVAVTSMDNSHV